MLSRSTRQNDNDSTINDKRVLIIGGAGKMGSWFSEYFLSQRFAVDIVDTCLPGGANAYSSWQEAGVDYDIIVVTTPLAASDVILGKLAAAKPHGLVFDIGSLKTPLRKGITQLREAGCKVASLHPMFGPDTQMLSGGHLIFVDTGVPDATSEAKALFADTPADQLDMSLYDPTGEDNGDRGSFSLVLNF